MILPSSLPATLRYKDDSSMNPLEAQIEVVSSNTCDIHDHNHHRTIIDPKYRSRGREIIGKYEILEKKVFRLYLHHCQKFHKRRMIYTLCIAIYIFV